MAEEELPVTLEYVWVDGVGDYRSKTKVVSEEPTCIADIPDWNFDGSSTYQAVAPASEVFLIPRVIFRDPFRRGKNKMVLCDCFDHLGEPIETNTRVFALDIFEQAEDEHPWFGTEQEYTLFRDGTPLGWPKSNARSFGGPTAQIGCPGGQGLIFAGAGADVCYGRKFADAHMKACLYAGIRMSGLNAGFVAGQWEYQVGPCEGIEAGDHVHMSRFLAYRLGEFMQMVVSFDPLAIPGDRHPLGSHTTFSTAAMRVPGQGFQAVMTAVERLSQLHMKHVETYGSVEVRSSDSELPRGSRETSRLDEFSAGVGNRNCSIRIARSVMQNGCGSFEDRRPLSNSDPYLVTGMLVATCVLNRT